MGGYSVFLYDMDAGTERLVRPGNGYFYLIAGWVDEDNILCYKTKDDTRTFVVVGTDGSETPLRFAAPRRPANRHQGWLDRLHQRGQ